MNRQIRLSPSRLVVGGHSFIAELGNDPAVDFERQLDIVNTCLDQGISCFDTTYEPERIALGRILETLKRRNEAQIIAWNFFRDPATSQHLVAPRPYEKHDIERLLHELRTDTIDLLVVHPVEAHEENQKQTEVALAWLAAGYVRALGTWAPGPDPEKRFGAQNPYEFMVAPRNVAHPNAEVFQASKKMGWRTFATSPFNRGWLLDRLLAVAVEQAPSQPDALRGRLADAMLRFSLHNPDVDHVIVGIRKMAWISQNLASIRHGPLPAEEEQWLLELLAEAK